ncbi:class I SAM-dependent methyltransferase [bacterium]|nr:class I SAM-dependent methyltransferase [bacterium]
MKISQCRVCKEEKLETVLEYGDVALADSFMNSEQDFKNEQKYPLRLCFCRNCSHLQIDEIIDPEILFRNYVYETGVSSSIIQFAKELYDEVLSFYRTIPSSGKPKVFEIASNDGTVLSVFKENDSEVFGVDPAENIVKIANNKGIDSIAEFFCFETAEKVVDLKGKFDVCLARNVIAHVKELHSVAKGIQTVLNENGFAVIEVPHLKTMFEELQYDQVFHEHIGFHSLDSIRRLFAFYDMEVVHVKELWIHGGSIRIFLQHKNGPRKTTQQVQDLLKAEEDLGLFDKTSWDGFAKRVLDHRVALKEELKRLKAENLNVAVYGASGKGQSLLQFCELDGSVIDYVVDKSSMKQGKFTPGTHLQVHSPSHIYEDLPDVILICAWNFADEIVKQEARFAELGGKFLHPLPMPHYLKA